ncbi:uncharacterized protein LOC113665984 [Pocillopora damicornis]|uniref:uncharacterized protein LOC113665984 n=1 Tax=Pocillopora damicornis TaxID=46731 RepID=UPI000F553F82|nr:uncharacterized protein LOC113665984 [Pocillopora damicornis]
MTVETGEPIAVPKPVDITVYAKMIAGYQPDRTNSDCKAGKRWNGCTSHFAGRPGISGGNGGNGGDGGRSGNGGDAGHQTLHALTVKGKIELTSCRGTGGQPAINGLGGAGGLGGRGGRGINCRKKERCGGFIMYTCSHWCESSGQTGEAARGATGRSGSNGKGLVAKGSNGQVESSYLQKFSLGPEQLKKYPLQLIKMMTRYGEELLWANDVKKSDAVFKFVVNLSNGNPEASELRRVAKRRLAFMNKVGYDRFGKNQLFAPIIKWEALKKQVEVIKDRAETFENAYNAIKESITRQDDVKTIVKALPRTTRLQVVKQKNRLEEARRVAVSEKGAYVLAIGELEASMKSNLLEAKAMLPDVYEKAKFNSDDLFVILEGITGFFSGAMGKDPFAALGSALGVIGHFAGKCDLGKLQGNLDKVEKWLKFGKDYAALKDSSELDFDKMDVAAVPEVMQANLEMNKEGLAADLVCLLDERSKPRNSAKFQEQIERYFIAGAARIDLIAKVMDLDNEIGGHNFDILNLEETANEIESLRISGDSPIAESTQQMFLDGLLTSYQHIETGFAQQLYQLYKGLVAKGSNGQVESSYLQKFSLGPKQLKKYPLQLIKMMTRYGQDLLWANNIKKSDAVFKFVVKLSSGKPGASELTKVAKRRLAFMNKVGYDRFGNNELFAPMMKWEVFKKQVEVIKDRAETFEDAYNAIKESIKRRDDVKTILKALPQAARLQVVKQKNRLEEARRVAVSEKGAYVLGTKIVGVSCTTDYAQLYLLSTEIDPSKNN